MVLKIKRKEFLLWRISDSDDIAWLGELVYDRLISSSTRTAEIDLVEDLWDAVGYIPLSLVQNKEDVIPYGVEHYEWDPVYLDGTEEIDDPSTDFEVEFI